jgi:hypothetical protein
MSQLLPAGGKWAGERTWALDVTDDGTGLVVHELDTALGDTTTGACRDRCQPDILSCCAMHMSHAPFVQQISESSRTGSAKDTGDLDELDGSLSRIHYVRLCVFDGCRSVGMRKSWVGRRDGVVAGERLRAIVGGQNLSEG